MVSLNDLDAQLADLEGLSSSCGSASEREASPPPPKAKKGKAKKGKAAGKAKAKGKAKKTRKRSEAKAEDPPASQKLAPAKKKSRKSIDSADAASADNAEAPVKKKRRRSRGESADASDDAEVATNSGKRRVDEMEDPEEANKEKLPKKKKDRAARDAVCFRYLKGACKFDDCKFQHVNPKKLTQEEQAQVLKELPLRAFDRELGEVIQQLNIPKCKDFHQRGGCSRPPGKCHFWHLTTGDTARWAGFEFWCDVCSKSFTSKDQMEEHSKAVPHLKALAASRQRGGGGQSAWGRGAGGCGGDTEGWVGGGGGGRGTWSSWGDGGGRGGRGGGGASNSSAKGGGRGRGWS